jgi:hypothetical protein
MQAMTKPSSAHRRLAYRFLCKTVLGASIGKLTDALRHGEDSETLTFLLRGGHLSVPDRIERGLWPHPPMKLSDVANHLAGILQEEEWFPRKWHPHV